MVTGSKPTSLSSWAVEVGVDGPGPDRRRREGGWMGVKDRTKRSGLVLIPAVGGVIGGGSWSDSLVGRDIGEDAVSPTACLWPNASFTLAS